MNVKCCIDINHLSNLFISEYMVFLFLFFILSPEEKLAGKQENKNDGAEIAILLEEKEKKKMAESF